MAKPVLKLVTPKDRASSLELVFFPQDNGKKGYGGYLRTTDDGQKLPPYRVALFVNNFENGDINLVIKGPIRVREDEHWVLIPRKNKDGDFLDEKGEISDENNADDTFSYIRDSEDKLIYGVVANLWITNIKKDKTPTKRTIISAKFYSDEDMVKLNEAIKLDDEDNIKGLRRTLGSWETLFIEDGFQFLREIGCAVRE